MKFCDNGLIFGLLCFDFLPWRGGCMRCFRTWRKCGYWCPSAGWKIGCSVVCTVSGSWLPQHGHSDSLGNLDSCYVVFSASHCSLIIDFFFPVYLPEIPFCVSSLSLNQLQVTQSNRKPQPVWLVWKYDGWEGKASGHRGYSGVWLWFGFRNCWWSWDGMWVISFNGPGRADH